MTHSPSPPRVREECGAASWQHAAYGNLRQQARSVESCLCSLSVSEGIVDGEREASG
jgi:hypothetical protein